MTTFDLLKRGKIMTKQDRFLDISLLERTKDLTSSLNEQNMMVFFGTRNSMASSIREIKRCNLYAFAFHEDKNSFLFVSRDPDRIYQMSAFLISRLPIKEPIDRRANRQKATSSVDFSVASNVTKVGTA